MLRRSASRRRCACIFWAIDGRDCEWVFEAGCDSSLPARDVFHDADGDERQKVESMFSKLWIRLGFIIFIVGGIVGLLAYGFTRDSRYIQSPLIAKPELSFTLTLFNGGTLTLKDLHGKAVLLNFWASWCACPAGQKPVLLKALGRNT